MMRSVLNLAGGIDPFHFWIRVLYAALTLPVGLYALGCLS
jgi:hypothetical protein